MRVLAKCFVFWEWWFCKVKRGLNGLFFWKWFCEDRRKIYRKIIAVLFFFFYKGESGSGRRQDGTSTCGRSPRSTSGSWDSTFSPTQPRADSWTGWLPRTGGGRATGSTTLTFLIKSVKTIHQRGNALYLEREKKKKDLIDANELWVLVECARSRQRYAMSGLLCVQSLGVFLCNNSSLSAFSCYLELFNFQMMKSWTLNTKMVNFTCTVVRSFCDQINSNFDSVFLFY
jgi:hypothetical protein